MINKIISRSNLAKKGERSKLELFMRPRKGFQSLTLKSLVQILKDDNSGNVSKTIARGVAAIVGAAYYDGGLKAANKVLTNLGLEIKVPA